MSDSFPISAPVEFTNTTAGDTLNFNADGVSTAAINQIQNFVTDCAGDLIYRDGTGTSNLLEKLTIGTTGDVLTVSGTPVAEVTTISATGATDSVMSGIYFLLSSPVTHYYVWFDLDNGDTDPGTVLPLAAELLVDHVPRTGIEIDVTTGDADTVIAATMRAVIGALSDFGTSGAGDSVVITNAKLAAADDAADSAGAPTLIASGLASITTTTPGVSSIPSWAVPTAGSNTETFLANVTATGTAVPINVWTTLTSTEVTWDDSTIPNHDTGAIFTPATGVLLIPTTGIWDVSATVQFEGSNSGTNGLISSRRAIRQVRIRNTTTGVTMAFCDNQASPDKNNPTQVRVPSTPISVTASDSIVVQVRHDVSGGLDIIFAEDGSTAGNATWFAAHRAA